MDISDFRIACINLDERTDRWEESQKEFKSTNIKDVQRVSAYKHQNPIVGCALSHFAVLEWCKQSGKHAMIFEDDVHFVNDFSSLQLCFDELNEWDMLYLGANITTPIFKVSRRLARLRHAQSTHAYCVNNKFIDTMLGYTHLLGKHMDLIYAEDIIPKSDNCFITIPMLAVQRASYSDVEKRDADYYWMQDRFWDNLKG